MALGNYTRVVLIPDASGNLALGNGASIEVRREDTGVLASIFEDRAGGTPLSNPFLADSNGRFEFYAAEIDQGYTVKVTKGSETYTLNNQNEATAGVVTKAEYDANTILHALVNDTPVPLIIGPSTLYGRGAAGNPVALTPAQVWAIINAAGKASQAEMEAAVDDTKFATPLRVNNHPGAAKFWAVFDGTAVGPISADAEHNVVDITDNGTGDYTINIDTDFSSANFAPFAMHSSGSNGVSCTELTAAAAGTLRIITTLDNAVTDPTKVSVGGFGDQ